MTDVTVGRRDGRLRIAAGPAPDAQQMRTVRLGVAGGVLAFEVGAADPVPVADLWDVDAAGWWLLSVYGADVAAAVADADVADDHGEDRIVPVDASAPLLDTVRRLGLALWMKRWCPVDTAGVPELSRWLLDVEAGLLAVDADHAVDPDLPLAAHLLAPHLGRIAANLAGHHARSGASGADEAIDGVLLRAASTALDIVPPATPGFDVLDRVERWVLAEEQGIQEALTGLDDALAALGLYEDRRVLAVVAGDDAEAGETLAAGVAPVDVRAVAAGVLSSADDAIAWSVHRDGGGLRCEVDVARPEATSAPLRLGELFVRVDQGAVVTAAVLDPGPDRYRAPRWLDATAPVEDLAVTVYGGVADAEAVPNRPVAERLADRDALRELVGRRAAAQKEADLTAWDRPFAAETLVLATVPLS